MGHPLDPYESDEASQLIVGLVIWDATHANGKGGDLGCGGYGGNISLLQGGGGRDCPAFSSFDSHLTRC